MIFQDYFPFFILFAVLLLPTDRASAAWPHRGSDGLQLFYFLIQELANDNTKPKARSAASAGWVRRYMCFQIALPYKLVILSSFIDLFFCLWVIRVLLESIPPIRNSLLLASPSVIDSDTQ
jgi:hypothetical protein